MFKKHKINKLIKEYKKHEQYAIVNIEDYFYIHQTLEINEKLIPLYQKLAYAILDEVKVAKKRLAEISKLPETEELKKEKDTLERKISYETDEIMGARKILESSRLPGSVPFYDNYAKMQVGLIGLSVAAVHTGITEARKVKEQIKKLDPDFDFSTIIMTAKEISDFWIDQECKIEVREIARAKDRVKTGNEYDFNNSYSVDEEGKISIKKGHKHYIYFGEKVNDLYNYIDIFEKSSHPRTFTATQLAFALAILNDKDVPFPFIERDKDNTILKEIYANGINDDLVNALMDNYKSVVPDYDLEKQKEALKKEYTVRMRCNTREGEQLAKELEELNNRLKAKKSEIAELSETEITPEMKEELEDLEAKVVKYNKRIQMNKDTEIQLKVDYRTKCAELER